MAKVYYNKLVRDGIKDKIEGKGEQCEVRKITDDAEFRQELAKKIVEEAHGLAYTRNREKFLQEYADLMVVLDALTAELEISEAEIKTAIAENVEKKGLYKKRHFLHWSDDGSYVSDETPQGLNDYRRMYFLPTIRSIWLGIVFGLCISLATAVNPVFANESIEKFAAEYTIFQDGTVEVLERIIYNFADNERRGIERILSDRHPQAATAWYKQRYVTISDITARKLADSELGFVRSGQDGLTIRVAYTEPQVTGIHEYEIRYTLQGALSYDTESAELYWNATGGEWRVPIQAAEVDCFCRTDRHTY